MRPFTRLLSHIRKYPVVANSITVGCIFVAGDVSQQTITGVTEYDWKNTRNIGLFSGTVFGPVYFYWYRFLSARYPSTALAAIGHKILLDQVVMGTFGTVAFFIGLSIMEGRENVLAELIEKGPKTYLLNIVFWPPAQFVNFRCISPRFWVVYVAACDFIWTNMLCFIKSQKSRATSAALNA